MFTYRVKFKNGLNVVTDARNAEEARDIAVETIEKLFGCTDEVTAIEWLDGNMYASQPTIH